MQVPSPSMREVASMYGTAVAVFLVILVAALQGSAPPKSPFPYRIPLDPKKSLELSWNVSYTQETIYFQLLVREFKAGVLFGMSDRGELENADLVVLWTDGVKDYFGDAWSDERGQIHLDPQQDYQLLQARRTPEGLCLLFKRPFGTCDPKDYFIEDGTVHLVYGFLEEPFRSLEAINTSGLQTGLQRVQLLKPDISVPALPLDVRTMEIRAQDALIPDKETTYWCHVTELPAGFSRHHIVMYEPIITKGNEALVHHMEVFQCAPQIESVPPFSGPCDSKMKPDRLKYCRHVLAAWALGAKAFYYPEEVGLAFGGPGSSRFLRLEVHYHNPENIQGRNDSSGIRLYYTATLRRYDAGIMELGLVYTPVMAIPPRETAFVLTGYCTDKCTNLTLPPSGIHIFASQLHTHLTGRKVVTVLARDGREKEIVNRDDHYSPHFQEIRMLKKIVSVQRGDVLITSCTYDTGDKKLATVGGYGINEEMCVNYVHYYPQTQLELCKSTMEPGFLQMYFHTVNRFSGEEVCTCPQVSVPERFASVPWNSFNRDMLKALYGFAPISMHCNKSSAVSFEGEWNWQPLPKIISKLKEPTPRCPASRGQSPANPTVVSIGGSKS
ncbi:dopamine beta-hydroxylase [Ursus maritimus]|uniref:Dopamine beta-hydroxylase n=2 Tax=Ursus TaxID=9639 RepID=A0A8M1FXL4_URSMA|nr:dopamine beta-hydroxylase [Ursus maritimus]